MEMDIQKKHLLSKSWIKAKLIKLGKASAKVNVNVVKDNDTSIECIFGIDTIIGLNLIIDFKEMIIKNLEFIVETQPSIQTIFKAVSNSLNNNNNNKSIIETKSSKSNSSNIKQSIKQNNENNLVSTPSFNKYPSDKEFDVLCNALSIVSNNNQQLIYYEIPKNLFKINGPITPPTTTIQPIINIPITTTTTIQPIITQPTNTTSTTIQQLINNSSNYLTTNSLVNSTKTQPPTIQSTNSLSYDFTENYNQIRTLVSQRTISSLKNYKEQMIKVQLKFKSMICLFTYSSFTSRY
ncbi:hypothetical protein ACTFIY_001432 [Dictyostelium cf. discoideum]